MVTNAREAPRVAHFGNVASNAYYNVQLLRDHAGIEPDAPIRMFGLEHAFSAPAWESLEFEVPSDAWVHRPDWASIPGAVEVNTAFSDLVPGDSQATSPTQRGLAARGMSVARDIAAWMYGRSWAQPLLDMSYRRALARRPGIVAPDADIVLLYGQSSLPYLQVLDEAQHIVHLEHGTIRWIGDGSREEQVFRDAYRAQVAKARHLWVTNLDLRTLEIAEDVAPGRWSALPHPFLFDARVPFTTSPSARRQLLEATDSSSLILLPTSQNWRKDHDKGTRKAIHAFVELRDRGYDVGLVAIEWGGKLAESKAFFEDAQVARHVAWVRPMPRIALQRMISNVDVVWDQFGLDAFGGVAMRVLEQGTPLVSRGLRREAEQLIGGPVPWLDAESIDDIVRATVSVLDESATRGREVMLAATRSIYRDWLHQRHAPEMTAQLQARVYEQLAAGMRGSGIAAPDEWARWVSARSASR